MNGHPKVRWSAAASRTHLAPALSALAVVCSAAALPGDSLTLYQTMEEWVAAQGSTAVRTIDAAPLPLGPVTGGPDVWSDYGVHIVNWPSFSQNTSVVEIGDQTPYGIPVAEVWGIDPQTHVLKAKSGEVFQFDLTVPTRAFALQLGFFDQILITLTLVDGTVEDILFNSFFEPPFALRFYGVVGSQDIAHVKVNWGLPTFPGSATYFYIQDLSFGSLLCPCDIDGDYEVDSNDLAQLLGAWGDVPASHPADFDANGIVDAEDLLLLLGLWGNCEG